MYAAPDLQNKLATGPSSDGHGNIFVFPTTAAQRRFWLLDQLLPGGNPALNMPIGLRWHGPLEHPILERAINELVTRHETLRTTFEPDRKQLQQLINSTLRLDLPMVEANVTGKGDAQELPAQLLREEACRPFDLRTGPLVRAQLVRLEPNEHLLLLTIHHIVSDGWSNMVLVRDLCAAYNGFLQGKIPSLPELPLQFADFADWQATRLAADDFAAQRAYWREKLSGNFRALELPFDRRQHGGPTAASETRSRVLSPDIVQAAKALGATEGASPFMVFLAAFQMLLHRYADQVDFLVTTPSANRDRPEFESIVGPFANPLLVRADLRGDPNFRELLTRVRTVALEAFSNQDIPFEGLLDEFRAERLQVNFDYEVGWERPLDLPKGLTVDFMPAISAGTVYELSASVQDKPGELRLEIEYKTALFDAVTIERMLDHFQILLQNAVADPARPISALPMLKPDEEQRLEQKKSHTVTIAPPAPLKGGHAASSEPVRPYLGLQLQLIAIWEDVLGVRGIGIRDDFFNLGGNSLLAIRMLQRAEAACGKVILPAALFRHPTIEHLAGEMAREIIDESPTLLRVNDAGTRTPFFYLHGDLSGGGFYSLKLSRALGHDQPFYVMPPQDIRSLPAAPTIEEMAAAHLDALLSVRPKGPYVIGGFCIGGVVAYELAQQIKARGEEVEMLLIIDAEPESKTLRWFRILAGSLGKFLRWDDDAKVRHFGQWAIWRTRLAEGFGQNVRTQTRTAPRRIFQRITTAGQALHGRLFGKPPTSTDSNVPTQIERDLPSAFQWASAAYRPQPYDGPIALLLSEDVIGAAQNPSREWQDLAPGTTVLSLPGSHLECITAHVETLAKEIENCLQRIAAGAHPQSERQETSHNNSGSRHIALTTVAIVDAILSLGSNNNWS